MTSVLFTCAGQRVDVVTAFGRAGARTVAVDANPLAPAIYHADVHAIVPRIDDPGYLGALLELIRIHDVQLVVPLTDLDQLLLAERRGELGAIVLLPEAEVVRRTADKYLAHLFFEERGIPSPPSWLPGDLSDGLEFPVLVKARHGFGSRHIYRADDREQLDFFLRYSPVESFVQRLCPGDEFSIDVFCDLDGRCLNSIPRTMIESKGGESIKGMTIKDPELIEFGRFVAEELGIRGPANIQCFRVAEGRHEVTDVNPRFGGAFPLPRAAGSRYPELALALARGERPEPRLGDFREGIVMTRFFSHLSLTTAGDGTLEPFAEELPEPVAGEPAEGWRARTGFGNEAIVLPVQEGQVPSGARGLRILFFVDRPGVLRQYSSLVSELAERGHEVELALGEVPQDGRLQLAEGVVGSSERATLTIAPTRAGADGWRSVAWLVRALGDLARYSHPRYEQAPVLRRRTTDKILGRLARPGMFEPLGRGLALLVARRLAATTDARLSERVIRVASRLEAAIPTSRRIDRFIRERAPDVVLTTSVIKLASSQVEFLKSARRLGIPAAICVASWDNLTNKGLLKFVPERVFVWNEVQRREATELHGIPAERVVATGAQLFDPWFERRPTGPREQFVRRIGLDPDRPYVLFLGSSPFVTNHSDDEVRFVVRWIEALRSCGDERLRRIGIAIRPHPVGKGWRRADLGRFENASIWPAHSKRPINPEDQADFFDSLAHSAAVVGINTTAMIEAAIAGKSVLTVLAPEFAQESTLHFHYLLEENGGFLHVASSLEEHAGQLAHVLDEGAADAEQRRRFVEAFVRPNGLDRPATPIFADAVEELAGLTVESDRRPGRLLVRPPLALEAALSAVAIRAAPTRQRLRRLRRRVGAKARRHGLLPSRSQV